MSETPEDDVRENAREANDREWTNGQANGPTNGFDPAAFAEPLWPVMDDLAYYGLAGEIVRRLEPLTEADPVAMLAQLLAGVGNAVGHDIHCLVGNTRHYANLFALILGITSKGRKGTSWDPIEYLLKLADPSWVRDCLKSGLSSGEGIIHAVHDDIWGMEKVPQGKGQAPIYLKVLKEPAVADKRLFVIEQEFAGTLAVMNRPGNSLSPVMRLAWDGRPLQTLTKNSPEKATDAHVSTVGHITVDEFRAMLDGTSKANGFANRFLCVLARRTKLLPFPGRLDAGEAEQFASQLAAVINNPDPHQPITFTAAARELWSAEYSALSAEAGGLFGAVVARAEAQVLRLSLVYALLDRYQQIHPEHLRAANAFWRYCAASARYIFGDALGDPVADTIMAALRQAGPDGMTRWEINRLFSSNHTSSRVGQALLLLLRYQRARPMHRASTGGRPPEAWVAI